MSGDPDDIVVEMTKFDKIADEESKRPSDQNKARLRSKINAKGVARTGSSGAGKDDFVNINRYVIDDDEEEDDDDSHRSND